jgi:excinuclease ABC subunit A
VPGAHDRVNGLTGIERVVEVDQSPIGRTPRSNPATYTGIFDEIRKHFAKVPEAKIRGYEPGRFSFNVKGGRCEACQGQGTVKIEMHFLPDVFVACDTCKGARYNRETLEIRFKGKSIAEVLDMTVDDAIAHFDAYPKVRGMLECLRDVGLGYMQLGQASTTVSGGEAQRIKLATELGNMSSASTLYVLDEPTTGLHFADVEKLLAVLQRLADSGHTLVVIEHSLDVVKCADWLVDLGPEGGERGGTIIATGTPEDVARNPASHTGRYLKPILERAGTMPGGRGAVTPAAAPASRTRAPASSRPRSGTTRARS